MSPEARQRARAWLGAGLIALLLVVAALIFMLETIAERLRSTYTVTAILAEAPRLTTGSRVWVSGRDVGSVREIRILPVIDDSLPAIAALLEIPTSVREHVRRDSRIRITSERMIGEPVIDILAGSPALPALAPGDTLRQAARPPDAAALLDRTRVVGAALDSALAGLTALRAPLQERMAAYGRVQVQLAAAQREYATLMDDVRASPTLALLGRGDVQASVARSRETLAQLTAALTRIRERARTSGAEPNLRAAAASATRLQASLAALDSVMRIQGGTADRLMRDSALVRAIGAARAELDSLMADAKRNPLRYVF